jgi:hypothetical protein
MGLSPAHRRKQADAIILAKPGIKIFFNAVYKNKLYFLFRDVKHLYKIPDICRVFYAGICMPPAGPSGQVFGKGGIKIKINIH